MRNTRTNKQEIIKIGEFIDAIEKETTEKSKIENHPNDTKLIWIKDKNLETLSVDEDGNIIWKSVEAVTRHPVINKDGTDTLLQVETKSGKKVVATKAKSFITLNENKKLVPTNGSELKIGTELPVAHDINNIEKGIYMDAVINIKNVKSKHPYVFDLTVKDTKTFLLLNGLCMYDTFHFTGIASKGTGMLGVPRLRELLSFSKNPKMPRMSIYLNNEYMSNKSVAQKIASYIKYTTIHDLSKKIEVYYDPSPYDNSFREKDNAVKDFKILNPTKTSCQNNISSLMWLFRIVLNKEAMLEKNVSLLDIKSKFCTFWSKRLSDPKSLKKDERLLIEKITQTSISTNYDNSEIPIVHIRLDMNNFDFSTIIGFQDIIMNKFKLKGIEGIDEINDLNDERIIIFNKEGDMEKKKQFVIYTEGINLRDIRYINGINLTKTITSDVVKIYKMFGIEAARTALVKELRVVIEGSGSFANYQHIAILVDVMTNTGSLTSIDRFGINRLDTDPLSRASFEKTVEQLLTAAVFGEVDSIRSVSSRIMVGRVIKGGTGLCELMMDTNLLENTEYMEEYDKPLVSTFNELVRNRVIKDTLEKDEFDIYMPDN